jgi:7-carboxy-7-deazaguanine synthase
MDINVTIQGEGKNIGTPIFLLRYYGCNLHCPWCDTAYAIKEQPIEDDAIEKISNIIKENPNINNIVFTGGEPFIYEHYKHLMDVVAIFPQLKNIEIETNGTLLENLNIDNINHFEDRKFLLNISPKLDIKSFNIKNYSDIEYIYSKSLIELNNCLVDNISKNLDYVIKFVYDYTSGDEEDIKIFKFLLQNRITKEKVLIMPLTPNKIDNDFHSNYHHSCVETVNFCIKNGFRYSPREHINLNII